MSRHRSRQREARSAGALAVLTAGIAVWFLGPVSAVAHERDYVHCFQRDSSFVCYSGEGASIGDWRTDCAIEDSPRGDPIGAAPPWAQPPAAWLSRDAFLRPDRDLAWPPPGGASPEWSLLDLDGDLLLDEQEKELARTFAPYLVHGWPTSGFFDSEIEYGEPAVLFQVRPTPEFGPLSPESRWVRIRYLMMWDHDFGYSYDGDDAGCRGDEHDGDNQIVDVVVWSPDGIEWRIVGLHGFDAEGSWPETLAWFRLHEGVHPVVFLSAGKHHHFRDGWCGRGGGTCQSPHSHRPDGVDPCNDWASCPGEDQVMWHEGAGRFVAEVCGSRAAWLDYARCVRGGSSPESCEWRYHALPELLCNNVGEPNHNMIAGLEDFCFWRARSGADLASLEVGDFHDAPQICLADEFAWDHRPFAGGHCPGCSAAARGGATSANASQWMSDTSFPIDDLDADGLPNVADQCPLAPYSPWTDPDGDGVEDACDNCPDLATPEPEGDADGDGIGNRCDLCPNRSRTDSRPIRLSRQYNENPGSPTSVTDDAWDGRPLDEGRDSDGDGIGDACDLCPYVPVPAATPYFREELDYLHRNPELWRSYDYDQDDIGDRCDNCIDLPNRDQHNCNAADEQALAAPGTWGTTEFGLGDACDPMPCVDLCLHHLDTGWYTGDPTIRFPKSTPVFRSPFFVGSRRREPAVAEICAVGGHPSRRDRQGRPEPATGIPTEVRGCWCPETQLIDCQTVVGDCRQGGRSGGTWKEITHPDGGIPTEATPSFDFETLYKQDATVDRGRNGERYEAAGHYFDYYVEPGTTRRRTQDWLWQTDFGGHLSSSERTYLGMWLKTVPPADLYGPSPGRDFRNTYTNLVSAGQLEIDPVEGGEELARRPEDVGGVLLPQGPVLGLAGRRASPLQWFADLVWSILCRVSSPCPWPDWMFFDERGPRVGGLLISSWSPERQAFANMVGTKLAGDEAFDVVSPGIAMSFDGAGMPARYWLFGGLDALDGAVDQMWGAVRVEANARGEVVAAAAVADDAMAPNAPLGRLQGATSWFQLARIPKTEPWPSGRVGAVLRCTGFGLVGGQPCDNLCPNVDTLAVATSDWTPSSGAGALLLVGGEGSNGLLGDIWVYGLPAVAGDVAASFAQGWTHLGSLAGVDGGLAEPGSIQLGRTLWLIGGRTASGATANAWRLDVDTGASQVVRPAGDAPAGRIAPAVTYDAASRRILVFGGVTDGGAGLTDLWALDPDAATWERLAAGCAGSGCPAVTGREGLVADALTGEITVVADPNGPGATKTAWTLRDGVWWTAAEVAAGGADLDCDGDGVADPTAGTRCGAGSQGFPDHGRMLCDGDRPVCRPPAVPARVLASYRMPTPRTVQAAGDEILVLRGSRVEAYRVERTGVLTPVRTIRLSRAAHDLAVLGEHLLTADARGLTVRRLDDGSDVSSVRACGAARRVFPVGSRRALVLGLRSVMLVDLGDPASPMVVSDVRLVPTRDGLDVVPAGGLRCRADEFDAWWDLLSPCGPEGRDVGAFEDGLLFVNVLGQVHVLDYRSGTTPVVAGSVPTGLVRDMRAEGGYLFASTLWGGRVLVGHEEGIGWTVVGSHELDRWVHGTAEGPWYAVWWAPGELQVATRQGSGAR